MNSFIIAYVATAIAFCIVDLAWLGVMSKRFYAPRMAGLLRERPRWGWAGLFYALYVLGIVIFAVAPALEVGLVSSAAVRGALFGFFAYATYDLTNYATLKNWPLSVALIDIGWGTVLTGAAAGLGMAGTHWALAL